MSSDETFLEAFLDNLSGPLAGLPNEIKRNLELMRDLDQSCSVLQENMKQRQQEYVQQAEEKVLALEVVAPPPSKVTANTTAATRNSSNTTASTSSTLQPQPGVRVSTKQQPKRQEDVVVIPTTEELTQLVCHPEALQIIRELQENALQQADEKVAIAEQTYNLVDAIVKRLDTDLEQMESLLQSTGQFVEAGAVDSIATPASGQAVQPGDLAAIQVTPESSDDWILAKVISHDPNTGMFHLSDEDVESSKIFHLNESQVVVLGNVDKLTRGDVVFAVYPDTTAFYQASVVQAPRKTAGGSAGGGMSGSFVMVKFVDDCDEHGITHDKAVPLAHIMLPPYGITIQ